jgi:pyruvate/2-oxoglutarate dehydrogenase complex dihydrolipoamide acyltransferase (E2) component
VKTSAVVLAFLAAALAVAPAQRGEIPVRPRREPVAKATPTPTPDATPDATPAPSAKAPEHKAPEPKPSAPSRAVAASPTPTVPALQRSVSLSKQFVVYNGDGTIRARVVRKVEDIKSAWLRLLERG